MHIHILGICGTFMGGIALLARQLGHRVSGSDTNVYPPMSTQLEQMGVIVQEGYYPAHLDPEPDLVVIGNALSRGNSAVEYILNRGLSYVSGPQYLADYVLHDKWVLAVAGTHGKTTTSSMLAWILDYAGMKPGFLIGGVPGNFGITARLGETPFFVVEADEYDTAFFDKRSKFVHYRPRTVVLNNLEYDHADIFPDLDSIKRQFHHLMRIVPSRGKVILAANDDNLTDVINMGCWSETESFNSDHEVKKPLPKPCWQAAAIKEDGSQFAVSLDDEAVGTVNWSLLGQHNMNNALAAIAAARHAGVLAKHAVNALSEFKGVKRRLEVIGKVKGITVYDDFAHHPTAITLTLQGLRKHVGDARIIALLDIRSNTMRLGIHKNTLGRALTEATRVKIFQSEDVEWNFSELDNGSVARVETYQSIDKIIADVVAQAQAGDHVLIMSNGGFGGIHDRLVMALDKL
ncbi:UDP-N-acetylmuramate:L-alanyl-gamma-D-glutamyl-meso-diaminopimelate ligase [hydrothermal vent metagenome]|uniref:UDP-N-acetylmuramate:L-alanyl-gamma-D-glutamyl-meso-diaminopimelate ligase n=1 Tax=hydrothermal vent metagenome TaxID=652676 RepID=A0A3B0YS33_9ZZZZ